MSSVERRLASIEAHIMDIKVKLAKMEGQATIKNSIWGGIAGLAAALMIKYL